MVKNTTPTLTTHVTSKLYVDTAVNKKQNTLTFMDSLVLNSIVVKPRFTKENYTPAEDGEIRCDILTVADVNISTLFSSKQDTLVAGTNITIIDNVISSSGTTTINDGDLTIAKTNGLQDALDSTAKLDSVNTFTANQNVNGDLKGYNVLVTNTTPTLTTHVTSKLYVDTAVNKKQNTLTFMDGLVLSSIVVKPASSKLVYTPAIDGEIKATTLTI